MLGCGALGCAEGVAYELVSSLVRIRQYQTLTKRFCFGSVIEAQFPSDLLRMGNSSSEIR